MLTIAVASDLHAFKRAVGPQSVAPSKLCMSDPEDSPHDHPFAGLAELIEREPLKADLLLCPGDMTYAADPDGLRYCWQRLHQFGLSLGTTLTAATTGNHDLDSRGITRGEEPKEALHRLRPRFPISDERLSNEFWSQHATIVQGNDWRLVILDSCVKHTNPSEKAELERGFLLERTLFFLRERLEKEPTVRTNILLCHHHPQPHSELHLGEHDVMRRGQLLLDLLAQYGNWLVIHGHKHHPKISYAAGGASGPVVLAAGSFSGAFGPEVETRTRNMFHMIEIDASNAAPHGIAGRVRSWFWAAGLGWRPPDSREMGLPALTGFGCRVHPADLAQTISMKMGKSDKKSWQELCKHVPALRYQLPQDYELMKVALRRQHLIEVIESRGVPVEIGKRP